MSTAVHTAIHIVVEVSKTDKRKLEFNHSEVTGQEIKEKANVPIDSDLARRVESKLELVANDEKITIKNGDQFVVLPPGSIS
jgi:hypothetical protein